jgi:hypothetical protein
MLVFLHTEFTSLLHPEPRSIGLLSLDGRELFAELDLTTDSGNTRGKASSEKLIDKDRL